MERQALSGVFPRRSGSTFNYSALHPMQLGLTYNINVLYKLYK